MTSFTNCVGFETIKRNVVRDIPNSLLLDHAPEIFVQKGKEGGLRTFLQIKPTAKLARCGENDHSLNELD